MWVWCLTPPSLTWLKWSPCCLPQKNKKHPLLTQSSVPCKKTQLKWNVSCASCDPKDIWWLIYAQIHTLKMSMHYMHARWTHTHTVLNVNECKTQKQTNLSNELNITNCIWLMNPTERKHQQFMVTGLSTAKLACASGHIHP